MTNVQQPEMRRNEHNPLVAEHREETAKGALPRGDKGGKRARAKVPEEQRSPYEPQPEK
jgi:hypothetical protein